MKKHAIIPIFIPHKGCPNDCVFCNQKKITARQKMPSAADVEETIERWLSTLLPRNLDTIEAAFFGGSFTGIPIEEQSAYLAAAKKYKDAGLIHKIHMSTRPDYINKEILDNLRRFDADTIELGVQSFDDQVLKAANRGHDSSAVYRACRLIQDYGFELGIQLMIGLPGDSKESCLYSAEETVRIGPSIARLYPTVVIHDTELYQKYLRGEYTPLTEAEAVEWTKEMYKILDDAGINIIRVGLKSTDVINENGDICGETYHPAFRQLVEGVIARERIEEILREEGFSPQPLAGTRGSRSDIGSSANSIGSGSDNSVGVGSGSDNLGPSRIKADFFANGKSFSNLVGHQGKNKKFFLENYPQLNILYKVNHNLRDNEYQVKIKGDRK